VGVAAFRGGSVHSSPMGAESTRARRSAAPPDVERRELLERVVSAAERERARLAADLHDGPVQSFAALDYRMEALVQRVQAGESLDVEDLRRIQEGIRTEVGRFRTLLRELFPPVLENRGLMDALREYASHVSEEGGVRVVVGGVAPRLRPDAETVLFRIAQEALANVVRHARASNAWVEIEETRGAVRLSVRDDGRGFEESADESASQGFGLRTMRFRAEMIRGRLEVRSRPGEGTRVEVVIPRERRSDQGTGPGRVS
jgi:signal transduction histidine kinase